MAHVHLVTALLNQLDDMETKLRLHNLRDLFRIGEVKSYRGKGGIERTTACETYLTTTTRCSRVFRVESGQRRERSLTFIDTVCILT